MEASRIPRQTDMLSEMQTEYLPGTSGPVFGKEGQLCADIVYRFWHDTAKIAQEGLLWVLLRLK